MKILYMDCFSGISGDMCLGALVDAGADSLRLEYDLKKLPLSGWEMRVALKNSHGITGTKVDILVREDTQPHRHYSDIRDLVQKSPLPEKAREIALSIFQRLAEAEGKVHGVPSHHVHFHEVGGVDSIIDIVGTSLALCYLEVDRVICSPVPPGRGTVKCRHGILPIPAPATAQLLMGVPLSGLDAEGELVTPTGAAIATTVAENFGSLPPMKVRSVGYGFGSKDFGIPNFLRVFLGEDPAGTASYNTDTIVVLETNIDDMNPEFFGHIMEKLMDSSALDVFVTPAYMKKNRPGQILTVLSHPRDRDILTDILFQETSTLGVRWREERRTVLGRLIEEVPTTYGMVKVKYALSGDGTPLRAAPEYEDCKKIAREKNLPVRKIYEAALLTALKKDIE
ncbi:MAG: hypothetical protein VR68_01445 [Peptococcaceae bacterium BRH_c4a]|nr:MAG: hypothetical protein VR68_01445 [Peptococcaceae bacterium BRH_c4a]